MQPAWTRRFSLFYLIPIPIHSVDCWKPSESPQIDLSTPSSSRLVLDVHSLSFESSPLPLGPFSVVASVRDLPSSSQYSMPWDGVVLKEMKSWKKG